MSTLKPAGDLTAGVQVVGAVKQYQYSGINDATSGLETIGPFDSGNVIGTVPPGKAGIKQISGVVQRAAVILCDGTTNALVPTSGTGVLPTAPAGSTAADGLSQAPQHE